MKPTPTFVTTFDLDRIDVESMRERIKAAITTIENVEPFLTAPHKSRSRFRANYVEALTDEARHETQYTPPYSSLPVVKITVGSDYTDKYRDNLIIHIHEREGCHALRLSEPIASDLFNALKADASPEQIIAALRRWLGYLDRIALPYSPLAAEMETEVNRCFRSMLEAVRKSSPEYDQPDMAFDILPGLPFRQPQILCQGLHNQSKDKSHQVLTVAGQEAFANFAPNVLCLNSEQKGGCIHLRLSPKVFEEWIMDYPSFDFQPHQDMASAHYKEGFKLVKTYPEKTS